MIVITPDILSRIEELASLFVTPTDIALVIGVPVDELRVLLSDPSSPASASYRRGKALAKIELNTQEMNLAKLGSPAAIDAVHRNLLDMEDDE